MRRNEEEKGYLSFRDPFVSLVMRVKATELACTRAGLRNWRCQRGAHAGALFSAAAKFSSAAGDSATPNND